MEGFVGRGSRGFEGFLGRGSELRIKYAQNQDC